MASPSNTPKVRPTSLPPEARWEPEHPGFEWIAGELDDDGKKHGHYRSWTKDGVLHGESWYEHGKLHGKNTNFHPDGTVSSEGDWVGGTCMDCVFFRSDRPTTEPFGEAGANVWSIRYFSHDGRTNYTIRYYDRAGVEIGPDGAQLPKRPPAVSPDARWFPDLDRWVDGEIQRGTNHQVGRWRWWARDGVLRHEELRDDDGEALMVAEYEADGTLEKKVTTTATGEERDYYFDTGQLSSRYREDAQGRDVYKGSWYRDGSLDEEMVRVFDGDELASVTERGTGGALVFEARREGPQTLACVLYHDDGRTIAATGLVRDGKLTGTWRLFDERGMPRREVDPTPHAIKHRATGEGLSYKLGRALYRTDVDALPMPTELDGVDATPWSKLEGAYGGDIGEFPSYLRALGSPDPLVRTFALGQIEMQIEHQGSTYTSTAAVIPWLARLLAHPNADRSALLAMIQTAGDAALPYVDEVDDDADEDTRMAIRGTVEAVARAWPQIWALFGAADADDRRRILTLAKFAPDATAKVLEVARRDDDPGMRACAIDSLTSLPGYEVADALPSLRDPDPLVRAATAIAIGRTVGPAAPPEVVAAIGEAVRGWRAIAPRFAELPYTDGHVLAYLAIAAGSVRSPEARQLAKPLCALIDEVDGVSATTYGQGLCALAFGRGERPFAPAFIEVLVTLANSKRFWAFNVNAGEVLDRWNLRRGIGDDARDGLTALVRELREAPDPEALLHERMHAGGGPSGDDDDDEDDDDWDDD